MTDVDDYSERCRAPDVFSRANLVETLAHLAESRALGRHARLLRQVLAEAPLPIPADVPRPEPHYALELSAVEVDEIVDYLSAHEARLGSVDAARADRLSTLVDRWVRYYLLVTTR